MSGRSWGTPSPVLRPKFPTWEPLKSKETLCPEPGAHVDMWCVNAGKHGGTGHVGPSVDSGGPPKH